MAIIRITDDIELKEGDLVVPDSILTHGLVGRARLITKVAGKRLYFKRPDHEPEDREQYMARKSAIYKVDTLDEANALLELSRGKHNEIERVTNIINAKYRAAMQMLIETGKIPEGVL